MRLRTLVGAVALAAAHAASACPACATQIQSADTRWLLGAMILTPVVVLGVVGFVVSRHLPPR